MNCTTHHMSLMSNNDLYTFSWFHIQRVPSYNLIFLSFPVAHYVELIFSFPLILLTHQITKGIGIAYCSSRITLLICHCRNMKFYLFLWILHITVNIWQCSDVFCWLVIAADAHFKELSTSILRREIHTGSGHNSPVHVISH